MKNNELLDSMSFTCEMSLVTDRSGVSLYRWLPEYHLRVLQDLVDGKLIVEYEKQYGHAHRTVIVGSCRALLKTEEWCKSSHKVRDDEWRPHGGPARTGKPWSELEDALALALFRAGASDELIMEALQRHRRAIWARLRKPRSAPSSAPCK